jgi:amino acid adenylation domain-containing protein
MARGWMHELIGSKGSEPMFIFPGENTVVTAEELRSCSANGITVGFNMLVLARTAADLRRYLATLADPDAVLVPVSEDMPVQRLSQLSDLLGKDTAGQCRSLAVVLTTSGSTGRPKAVGLEMDALKWFASSACSSYGISAADRILVTGMVDGDYYLEELLLTLGSGAAGVVLPPDHDVTDPEFPEWVAHLAITVIDLPLTRWRQLAMMLRATGCRLPTCVRLLLVGGEPLTRSDVADVRELTLADTTLINIYGPTETTIVSTRYVVPGESVCGDQPGGSLPIGKPLHGMECYVVGEDLLPSPSGTPGELLLGGPGLARGYVGDPAGTAVRFIPDALSGSPGRRLYRTGDRVLQLENGDYHFLGRIDEQVKVRGFRVEPGEVEAALLRLDTVDLAAVRPIRDPDGEQRLVAYVPDAADPPTMLRERLTEMLPSYMIPTEWVRIDHFPLTPTGKIDKNRLPAGSAVQPGQRKALDITLTERLVGQIWSDVLGIGQVKPTDSFFHLGGQSREGVQVLINIRDRLGIDLGLAEFLRRPVLRDLASHIDEMRGPASADRPVGWAG